MITTSIPVAPATIDFTNRSWPGTSTIAMRWLAELERREAELGRDPALLLDRQAIGVDAGQRLHQRRLAVVDVTGGADDDRHGYVSSRSSRFRILPVGLRGSSARNVTLRGRL